MIRKGQEPRLRQVRVVFEEGVFMCFIAVAIYTNLPRRNM